MPKGSTTEKCRANWLAGIATSLQPIDLLTFISPAQHSLPFLPSHRLPGLLEVVGRILEGRAEVRSQGGTFVNGKRRVVGTTEDIFEGHPLIDTVLVTDDLSRRQPRVKVKNSTPGEEPSIIARRNQIGSSQSAWHKRGMTLPFCVHQVIKDKNTSESLTLLPTSGFKPFSACSTSSFSSK